MSSAGKCMSCKAIRILKRNLCKRCRSNGNAPALEAGNVVPC